MKINNGVKIAAVYGTVFLGAGFVSGRELIQYFVGFGRLGILGIIFAGVIFSLVGWAVLSICRREKINTYSELMAHLFGKRLGAVTEWVVAGFLFCLFVAMLAGAGATVNQAFDLPFTVGALAVGIVVFIILCFGLDGIVKVNVVLAPFMLVGGIFIGLFSFFTYSQPAFLETTGLAGFSWVLMAMVYASYNLVTGIPVLTATSTLAETKRDTWFGGLVGGGLITLVGICMSLPLFLYYADIITLEIPFLFIVSGYGSMFSTLYLAVLIVALLTTAACNAFAVLQWLGRYFTNSRLKTALVLSAVAVLASHVGFSTIVAYVYPAFGFLGLFKIIVILFYAVCKPIRLYE